MKFKNFLNHRIMNEASEIEGGGADDSIEWEDESEGEDEDIFEDDPSELMNELGLDPNKYGLDEDEKEEASEEEKEQDEAGQATDEKSFLERLNALGATHNELPVKVESLDEVKSALQMYKDYTVKTQSLSEERKAWEAEKTSTETELSSAIEEFNNAQKAYGQQLQELEQWTFTINQLKESAPDIFEEVQRAYEGTVKQYSNPVLNQQLAAMKADLEETKKSLLSEKNKLVVGEFDAEKSAMTATEQSLKELGVTIDWAEVKKEWANTGMPVSKVVGSIYFDKIAKAQASKSKVETVRQKVKARPAGAAGASRPGAKVPQVDRKLSYYEQAQQLINQYK